MAPYRIRTLGAAGVDRDDEPVDITIGKPFGLLVLLTVSDEPVRRSELARLLWPEADEDRGRQSVRQALVAVRQALGEDVFTGEDPVSVDRDRVTSDVAELRAALEAGRFEDALEIRGGGFLEDVAFSRAAPFEVWIDETRAELDRTMGRALELEAASRANAGDHAGALRLLDHAAAIRPSAVSIRIARIESLLSLGNLAEARVVLARLELAALTEAEVERYAGARERLYALADEQDAGHLEDGLVPELVGRAEELAVLNRLWREASSGTLRTAELAGPPGIGKTRLAREFVRSVAPGGRVAWLTAYANEVHSELSALTALVSGLLELPGAVGTNPASDRVLLSLVPGRTRPDAGESVPQPRTSDAKLGHALADLMAAVSFEEPLLLVCDDIQWMDDASRRVLVGALRHLRDEPVMTVLCSRASEPAGKPARPELDPVELWLEPLDTPELAELLLMSRFVCEPETARALARRVQHATGGSPLLVVELLEEFQRIGAMAPAGSEPRLDPDRVPDRYWEPDTVRGLVAQRIRRLSPTAGLVCAELARHGRPMPVQALVRATDLENTDVQRACAEMAEQGIALYDGTTVRFAHDTLLQAARRSPGRGVRRWATPVAILAGVSLLAVAALTWFEEAPYGGGTLLGRTDSGWVEITPRRGGAGRWLRRPLPDTLPPVLLPADPRRVVDGAIEWYGAQSRGTSGGPDLVHFVTYDSTETIVSGPGDIAMGRLHPDGRALAYKSEDTTAVEYRDLLMLADPDGDDERVLYEGRSLLYPQPWAPDGRFLPVFLPGPTDTLLLLSRSGREIHRFHFDAPNGLTWCGPRLAVLVMEAGRHVLRLADPGTGEVRTYEGTAIRPLACSPDGSIVIHGTAREGVPALVTRDVKTGTVEPLPFEADLNALFWLPDAVPSLPIAIEATPDSVRIAWGERHELRAAIRMSTGERIVPDSVEWESLEPAIASVGPTGRLVANRPGRTAVLARAAPYLVDSVYITVEGQVPDVAAVRESFETLDTARWMIVGHPPPTIGRVGPDSQSALSLTGDEKWVDGIVLRNPVRSERGLTAELEGRVTLTRDTWQNIRLCILGVDPGSIDRRTGLSSSRFGQTACVRYPAAEGARFDPAELALTSRTNPGSHLPVGPPGDDWFHLAVQIRPDGNVSAYMNHRLVGTAPIHLSDVADTDWTVRISGASVGTDAHVREFTLWTEARYRE